MTARALVAACAAASLVAGTGAATAAKAPVKKAPSIQLLTASAVGENLGVRVKVANFRLTAGEIGQKNRAGRGHYLIFANGRKVGRSANVLASVVPKPAITPGVTYKIQVQLATNKGTPVGKRSNAIAVSIPKPQG